MKDDITDEDFYWVFLRSKESPIPVLREGDDDSYRVRLSIAKEIVKNFNQDNATLLDYSKYLLRLLLIRENWLRPEIIAHLPIDLLDLFNDNVCKCTDIAEAEIIPLLSSALFLFCKIDINPDYPQKIIGLLSEQGHIERKRVECCNHCYGLKYRVTHSGKRIAERSEPRLLRILDPDSQQEEESLQVTSKPTKSAYNARRDKRAYELRLANLLNWSWLEVAEEVNKENLGTPFRTDYDDAVRRAVGRYQRDNNLPEIPPLPPGPKPKG